MIDCANDYGNEHIIGEALKELFEDGIVKRYKYEYEHDFPFYHKNEG